jgi:hypothetical protein
VTRTNIESLDDATAAAYMAAGKQNLALQQWKEQLHVAQTKAATLLAKYEALFAAAASDCSDGSGGGGDDGFYSY